LGNLFGTDGVRGIANKELTPELAYSLGKAGAKVLSRGKNRSKIVMGKDTRISGDMLEAALTAGICSMGVDVLKLGVIPTPGIAYLTRILGADAGVVISASHNPAQDNGIKFFAGTGYKLLDSIEEEIESVLEHNTFNQEVLIGGAVGRVIEIKDAIEQYASFLKGTACSLKGLKIVLDCANGASSIVGPKVLEELGAEVIPFFNQPDGININVCCGSTHPEAVAKKVMECGADLGLACDGDADRMIVVDEKGNIIDGDFIMSICALFLKELNKLPGNSIVVTVMSNMGLHKAMKNAGITLYETKVGDRYVMEKILETGAVLGGEQSGHIIFHEHNTTGDGLLSALQLLSVVQAKGVKLSELASCMMRFPQVLINTVVENKERVLRDPEVKKATLEVAEILGEEGRILVRPSGTEPLVRVMVEGPDEGKLKELAEKVVVQIKRVDENYHKII